MADKDWITYFLFQSNWYHDNTGLFAQNVMTFYSSIMLVMYMGSVLANMCCFTFLQDIHDIRNFYDSLLSAAAATANSAYGSIYVFIC